MQEMLGGKTKISVAIVCRVVRRLAAAGFLLHQETEGRKLIKSECSSPLAPRVLSVCACAFGNAEKIAGRCQRLNPAHAGSSRGMVENHGPQQEGCDERGTAHSPRQEGMMAERSVRKGNVRAHRYEQIRLVI